MEDPVARMQQRILVIILEEIQGSMNALMRNMLDPSRIVMFIESLGYDISQLPRILGQHPGFDPYQVLVLDKSASDEEVKHRYRELMHRLHPDKSGTPGTDFLFRIVMAAYERIKQERGWR